MIDFDIIPCIRDHKHLWNAHKVCQWCHNEKDHIELLALRMRIEELEKHKEIKEKQMTREEKVDTLIAQDIMLIRDEIDNRDYEFIYSILKGDGWTQYDLLSDEQINDEFKDRFDEIIKCSGILALANRLNGNFINFIKK